MSCLLSWPWETSAQTFCACSPGNHVPKLLQPPLQVGLTDFAKRFPVSQKHLLQHPLRELGKVEHKRCLVVVCEKPQRINQIQRGILGIKQKSLCNGISWASVHQRIENLIRQASQPLVIHFRAFLLRLSLLQEPVTVLIDSLHDISEDH